MIQCLGPCHCLVFPVSGSSMIQCLGPCHCLVFPVSGSSMIQCLGPLCCPSFCVFLVLCECLPACFCFKEADILIILRKSICFSVLQVTYKLIFHCVFQTYKPKDVIWIAHWVGCWREAAVFLESPIHFSECLFVLYIIFSLPFENIF